MLNLSDLQRSQIVGARIAGASVTETFQFIEVSRGAMSYVMTAYTQYSKTRSSKQNRGRKEKLRERDRRVLKRIVTSKMLTTAEKVTAELYQHLHSPESIITIRMHLHKQNIYGRVAFPKPLVADVNTKCRLQWCYTHKTWSINKWKKVICPNESPLSLTHTFPYNRTGALCTLGAYPLKRMIMIVSFQLLNMEMDLP
ncbi:transposable element Tcb1 transposase [Trichonephila clavipes]|nr:transposable element Tcb1 transposase [Trichonephila clavipes]